MRLLDAGSLTDSYRKHSHIYDVTAIDVPLFLFFCYSILLFLPHFYIPFFFLFLFLFVSFFFLPPSSPFSFRFVSNYLLVKLTLLILLILLIIINKVESPIGHSDAARLLHTGRDPASLPHPRPQSRPQFRH